MQPMNDDSLIEAMEQTAAAIARLCEAPRGLKHSRHHAHLGPARAKVKAVLGKYFHSQGKAVLRAVRPHLKSVIQQFTEAVPHTFGFSVTLEDDYGIFREANKRFANTLLPSSLQPLKFAASDSEDSAYQDAIGEAIAGAMKVAAEDMGTGARPSLDVAQSYLRDNSLSKLTGDLEEATKSQLRNAVADAWDKGGSYNDIVGAIQDTFDDFSDARAGMIAQTEANDAYNEGRRAIADAAGFNEKAWEPDGECCELCQGNVDAGWIDIDDDFPSGDSEPTAHPNCDCSVNYRNNGGSDEE